MRQSGNRFTAGGQSDDDGRSAGRHAGREEEEATSWLLALLACQTKACRRSLVVWIQRSRSMGGLSNATLGRCGVARGVGGWGRSNVVLEMT